MVFVYKDFWRLRTVLYALFAAVLSVFVAVPVMAQTSADVYTIEDVQVDITADNAVQAREKAFQEAQVMAYRMLAEKILSDEELMNFTMPPADDISMMVQDFEVTNEQLSAVRYKGTYTFRFRPNAIREYASREGMSYTDLKRRPVLVLPIYQSGERTLLWEDNNPWMAAWARSSNRGAMVPVVIPTGDMQDVSWFPGDRPLNYSPDGLNQMMSRYQAEGAFILIASPQQRSGMSRTAPLRIDIYEAGQGRPTYVQAVTIEAHNNEASQGFYARAVQKVRDTLRGTWKEQTIVNPAQVNEFKSRVSYSSVQQWVEMKSALENVPGMQNVQVNSLKPRGADLLLKFNGDESRLRLALSQQGIAMHKTQSSNRSSAGWQGWNQQPAPAVYELQFTGPPQGGTQRY